MVQPHDYLNMHNMRVTRDSGGRGNAGKPVVSTQSRHVDSATGTKRTIGSITDEVKSRCYRFNHNTIAANNKIIAWDRKTNQAFTVLQESNVTGGLGFSPNFVITGLALIGDYLYWCDGPNKNPRRINVERGIKTNHPAYTSPDGTSPDPYTVPLEQWDISVARRAPSYALKWAKLISNEDANVPDQPVNYLVEKNGFQFAFRYFYESGEYSTLGGYSMIAPNNADGRYNRFVYKYDTIRVSLDKEEQIEPEVKRIEFLVRRDNIGSWYIIKSWDRITDEAFFNEHNTLGGPALNFLFYNRDQGIAVADAEAYVPYFDVPILSNCLEIANNRLFLGNNVKGYDFHFQGDITVAAREYTGPTAAIWRLYAEYFLIEWNCGTGLDERVVYRIGGWFGPAAGWYDTTFTSAQFNSNSLPTTIIVDQNDKYPVADFEDIPVELIHYINPTCNVYTFTPYTGGAPEIDNTSVGSFHENARAFRKGKTYEVRTVFYDFAGRNAGATHASAKIEITPPTVFEKNYVIGIDWELENVPAAIPLWAHSYGIVRNRVTEPFVATITGITGYANLEDDGTYTFETSGSPNDTWSLAWEGIGIDLNRLLLTRGIGYVFSEGDIAKVVNEAGETFFLKITGTYLTYIITEPLDIGTLGIAGGSWYVEIITPKEEDGEYFEVGRSYEILNPGTALRSYSMASGTLFGDTYFVSREGRPEEAPLPAMNPNNKFWEFWPQDYGRPVGLIFSEQRRYDTEVAWSSTYFPGTETNQLNQFLSGDIRTLDSGIGALQILKLTSRTQDYGTVMLVLGQAEAVSMYLGRTEFYNAAEIPSLINTVDVIGTINVLRGGYGTLNPESFVENDGDAYWFSAIKSAWCRYSKAGVEPISDRKFSIFAAWLGNIILTTANDVPGVSSIKIPGGFDEFNKEYVCTVPAVITWPVAYPVLDVETDVTITEMTLGSPTAPLIAGEIYRFTFTAPGPVLVNVTLTDLFYGQKTFNGFAAVNSFLFVAPTSGTATFTVVTTPPLAGVVHTYSLKKLRINPYIGIDFYPKTVVFSEATGRFAWNFNAVPGWWGRVGDKLLSFKAGTLWSHDASSLGTYHGIQYPAWVAMCFNQPPNEVKRLQGFSLEADGKPEYVHFRTEGPFVQSSDLLANEIDTREGIHSASARRDRLSPNTAGTVVDKLLKGDEMRGRFHKVLFEWRKTNSFVARIFNLIYRSSTGHKI